ncbi:MAG: ABC transporter substrate-binding protein [Bacteroidales bacterium]
MNTTFRFLIIGFLSILLSACVNTGKNASDNNTESIQNTENNASAATIQPQYAKGFTVEYIPNAKLVTIQDPDPANKSTRSYHFALVAKGMKEKVVVPTDYQIIETPVKSIICMTTLQLAGFITLDELDKITGVTSTRFLHNHKMQQRLDSGFARKIGIEGNFDNEIIMNMNPDIIFISPFKRGGYENLRDVQIPLVPHLGYKELTPLGQAEWIKFIALFINAEEKANTIFSNIEKQYNKLKALTANVKHRPVVFSGEMRGGGWYTVGGQSFLAQIFRDAGADYFLKDNTESGGVTLDFETIYSQAAHADYWRILNGYAGVFSYDVLKGEDNRYADFKAFKDKGVIYCNLRDKGFYENSPTQPQLVLKDFIKVFHPDLIESQYKGTFYELLIK